MEDASPEDMKAELDRWEAFGKEASEAGAFVAGDALQESSTATTLRIQEHGDPIVSDGPFVETKEQLGGYYVLDCKDLDEALEWGRKIPLQRRQHRGPPGDGLLGVRLRGSAAGQGGLAHGLTQTNEVVGRLFRHESGRAVATLIRILGDFDLAEEAVQEAFVVALERWPRDGLPDNPAAWIVRTARNRAIDRLRRERLYGEKLRELERLMPGEPEEPLDSSLPDDRLRLFFTCCHPALAAEAQVALTLRTLGGLTTPEVARAFLTRESAMQQRLVRAKRKIRGARHSL